LRLAGKRTAIVTTAAALAVVFGIVVYLRTSPDHTPDELAREEARKDLRKALVDRGQAEYRKIGTRRFADFESWTDVRSLLEGAMAFRPQPKVGSQSLLLDQVSRFVYLRFVSQSGSDYEEWRRSTKGVLVPLQELKQIGSIGTRYKDLFGRPLPEAATPDQLFREFWDSAPDHSGTAWPIGIAAEDTGLLTACGPFDFARKADRPSLSDKLPRDLWIGDIGLSAFAWWTTPGAKNGALAPNLRQTECAEVGLVLECLDGARRPLVLTFLWDRSQRNWVLAWANLYNYPTKKQFHLVF
jgi:hypothetical protein